MAFKQVVSPFSGRPRAHPSAVSVSSIKHGGRRGYATCIAVGAVILTELGWERGQRVQAVLGDKRDLGWIKLKRNDLMGFALVKYGANSTRAAIRIARLGHNGKRLSEIVEHKIKNGALYVRLPDWATEAACLPETAQLGHVR